MREAERLADRIVMIHKGRVLKQGSLVEMREETNLSDLDDIFIYYINQANGELKVAANEF
jgi:sodium transport system ATP-binding protein